MLNCINVVTSSNNAELNGFTIEGGNANYLTYYEYYDTELQKVYGWIAKEYIRGGGILCINNNMTVRNCTFSSNKATIGGAIYFSNSNSKIENCTFINNEANPIANKYEEIDDVILASGGAIDIEGNGSLNISKCIFKENVTTPDELWGGGPGGAIFISGGINSVRIESSSFSGNCIEGVNGCSIFSGADKLVLSNTIFTGNREDGYFDVFSHNVTATNCVFHCDNHHGTMMLVGTTMGDFTNCTFSGGLISLVIDQGEIKNCIFYSNIPTIRELIYVSDTAMVTISNSNVKGSGGSDDWDLDFGIDGGGNIDDNPKFVMFGPDGEDDDGDDDDLESGIYGTNDDGLRLAVGSPCINAGTNPAVTNLDDIVGNFRIAQGIVDMGAYESGSTPCNVILVKQGSQTMQNGKSWSTAYTTLQAALVVASSGKEIWVAADTYYPGTSRSDAFQLKSGVAIYGGFTGTESSRTERNAATNITILSGDIDSSGNNDCYHVIKGANNAILDGFTITKGYANGATNEDQCGGGIYNYSCSPTISNCILVSNYAILNGGGIYNYGETPQILNCIFRNNTAISWGGAIACNQSNTTITNCTMYGNTAAYGGAVTTYNNTNYTTITNSILWGNSYTSGGAGAQIAIKNAGKLTLSYSDLQGGTSLISKDSGCTLDSQLGNINADPLFADAVNGDFHLKSNTTEGRWNGTIWVTDAVLSPCINNGDVLSPYSNEPLPNGNRINMGAYGNNSKASKYSLDRFNLTVLLATDDGENLPSDAKWYVNSETNGRNGGDTFVMSVGNINLKITCTIPLTNEFYVEPVDKTININGLREKIDIMAYRACGYLIVQGMYAQDCSWSYGDWMADDGLSWHSGVSQYKVLIGNRRITFSNIGGQFQIPAPIMNVIVSKGSNETLERLYELKEIYVDGKTGSNSNKGNFACPFRTMQKAFSSIPTGGGIILIKDAPGASMTFNENFAYPTNRTITVYNQNAATVTIKNIYSKPSNIINGSGSKLIFK